MLAEDDPTMLGLLRTLLRLEKFEPVVLSPSEDVLGAFRREKPDVVILDIHLVQGNGLDFMRAVRKSDDLKDLKVIMSSGMNMEMECIEAGANAFLLKPYMPDDLTRLIRKQLPA
jgi:DNA-binding response OmpR family regulator